jgi:hypothetical protein
VDNPRPADLGQAGALLLGALVDLAKERQDVRTALTLVLRAVGAELPVAPASPAVEPTPREQAAPDQQASEDRTLVDRVLTPSPPPTASGGLARIKPEGDDAPLRPPRQVSLAVVVRRARWKAAACRLAIDLRGSEGGGPSEAVTRVEENLRRQRADLEDCWAWMLDTTRPLPEDRFLTDVAACYDTVATAAESVLHLNELGALKPKPPSELLYLLAEAQSALLSALHKCDLRGDSDQRDLFLWLKDQTTRHRIYVDRHMRLDDPAGCGGSEDLCVRLTALVEGRANKQQQGRLRGSLLGKVRYHLGKARGSGGADEQDLRALEVAAGEWLDAGLSADDAEFAPMVRELAGAAPTGEATTRILRAAGDQEPEVRRDVMAEAAPLLEGMHAVLLGDEQHEAAIQGLAPALGLASVEFVRVPEEGVLEVLQQAVAGPRVELVMIVSRLPHDGYAEFKRLCLAHDRPFVRLPDGVEPRQVAHQVLRQVAWRLRQGETQPAGEARS